MRWSSVLSAGTQRLRSVLALLGAALLPSCEGPKSCTLIGCDVGVQVSLATPASFWSAGTYTVAMEADDEHLSCELTVSTSESSLVHGVGVCPAEVELWLGSSERVGGGVAVASLDVALQGTPRVVRLGVARGEDRLYSESFEPTYTTYEPNGPGCGECRTARVEVVRP